MPRIKARRGLRRRGAAALRAERPGEHTWVEVEKRLRTTEEVAAELAAAAGVDAGRVGWAGRKDREAVTRQWLSVPALAPARAGASPATAGACCAPPRTASGCGSASWWATASASWCATSTTAASAAATRLAAIARDGCQLLRRAALRPRRRQRRARRRAAARRDGRGGRRQQRLYLSALQSAIFNDVLRTRPAPPHVLLPGDLALVHGSGALLLAGSPRCPAAVGGAHGALRAEPHRPARRPQDARPRGEALARERAPRGALANAVGHRAAAAARPHAPRRAPPAARAVNRVSHRGWTAKRWSSRFVLPPAAYATVLSRRAVWRT
jgi:tRNA pseudouridine13 synthase